MPNGGNPSRFRAILLINEPTIGWKNATVHWSHGWTAFLSLTYILNAALLLWSALNIILICRKTSLISKPYFITLNLMVLLFAITRLLAFSIDPFGIKDTMPKTILNILLNVRFPCLTVGFTMLYCGLRQYCRPGGRLTALLVNRCGIIIFAFVCFIVSIGTDIMVSYAHSTELMILICQMFYVVWGVVFFGFFIGIIFRVNSMVRANRKKRSKACYKKGHCLRQTNTEGPNSVPPAIIASGLVAISFLVIAFLNLYLILAEIGLIKDSVLRDMCDAYRSSWPFFAFKSALQLCEHLMALGLVIAGTQPSKCMQIRTHTPRNVSALASADFSADLEAGASNEMSLREETTDSSLAVISSDSVAFIEIQESVLSSEVINVPIPDQENTTPLEVHLHPSTL